MSGTVQRALGFMKMGRPKPVWFDTVSQKYPPLTFKAPTSVRLGAGPRPKNSPQPIWRPPKLEFPEDKYVSKIYDGHPLERLRPTTLCETSGDPADTRKIINHQLELMEAGKDASEAFKIASEKFWEERKQAEIKEKVAKERGHFMTEQEEACKGGRVASRRHEPIGDTIRSLLLEEKAALFSDRQSIQNPNQH